MEIVLVSWNSVNLGFGGVEGHIHFLQEALRSRGHAVETIELSRYVDGRPPSPPSPTGRAGRAVGTVLGETATNALGRIADGRRATRSGLAAEAVLRSADIIHFHDFFRIYPLARSLRKLTSARLIWTNHLGEFLKLRQAPLGPFILHALTAPFDRAIGPSRDLSEQSCIRAPAVYIPNGVDCERFPLTLSTGKRRSRSRLGLGPSPLVVVPRRWAPTKGVLEAAEAARRMTDHPVQFAFLGSAGARDYPEYGARVARQLAGLASVTVRESVPYDEMSGWLRAADVVLVPSHLEATSLSALEAMASGAVVLASRTGGLTELVDDGCSGFLLDSQQPGDIEAALRRVLSLEPAVLDRVRVSASDMVRDRYSWAGVAQATERVYLDAMQGTRR